MSKEMTTNNKDFIYYLLLDNEYEPFKISEMLLVIGAELHDIERGITTHYEKDHYYTTLIHPITQEQIRLEVYESAEIVWLEDVFYDCEYQNLYYEIHINGEIAFVYDDGKLTRF